MQKCPHCEYKSQRTYNMHRHTTLMHKSDQTTENSQPVQPPKNVTEMLKNVTEILKNVTEALNNVTIVVADEPPATVPVSTTKRYPCTKCDRTFSKRKHCEKHSAECIGINPTKQCIACGKIYANRYAKYHHLKKGCGTSQQQVESTP